MTSAGKKEKLERIERLVQKVQEGNLTEQELINLYKNSEERDAGGDTVVLLDAIILKLRKKSPKVANRIFGAKQTEAQARLERVLRDLTLMLDLSANRVGKGVKAGGEMIAGQKYVDLYISYKNASNQAVSLSLTQDNAESELVAWVHRYKTGVEPFRNEKSFTLDDFQSAVDEYTMQLTNILLDA